MDKKSFIELIILHKKYTETFSKLSHIGVNVIDFYNAIDCMISHFFRVEYNNFGVDWIEWFIYENKYGMKEWGFSSATDENGAPICYDVASTYDYIKQYENNKLATFEDFSVILDYMVEQRRKFDILSEVTNSFMAKPHNLSNLINQICLLMFNNRISTIFNFTFSQENCIPKKELKSEEFKSEFALINNQTIHCIGNNDYELLYDYYLKCNNQ